MPSLILIISSCAHFQHIHTRMACSLTLLTIYYGYRFSTVKIDENRRKLLRSMWKFMPTDVCVCVCRRMWASDMKEA